MYLRAISQGYAVPEADFDASVHSVFQSALNLRLSDDLLLTLVVSSVGDLPQGIRLDTPEGFLFEDFRLGELVICRNGILHFEKSSLTIQLSGARRWKCDLPALKFDPADEAIEVSRTVANHPRSETEGTSPTYLPAAWGFVWDALNKRQKLSEAEIIAEELFHKSTRAGVSCKAGEAMRDLVNAARRYNLNASAIKALIGLGSGLTPSGDDMLIGYLAGLWCTVQNKSERTRFVSRFGKQIISFSSKTNDISRTYLYHAAQGQVSSQLADLAEGICREEDHERLSKITEAAFSVGHSSGTDTVTGLLIGLITWMAPEISCFLV